jgi:hypothetical protein
VIAVARKPREPLVAVVWVRDMTDAVGGGNIDGQVYRGLAGQRARIPAGAAQVLEAGGFVRRVTGSQQSAQPSDLTQVPVQAAPAAGAQVAAKAEQVT